MLVDSPAYAPPVWARSRLPAPGRLASRPSTELIGRSGAICSKGLSVGKGHCRFRNYACETGCLAVHRICQLRAFALGGSIISYYNVCYIISY